MEPPRGRQPKGGVGPASALWIFGRGADSEAEAALTALGPRLTLKKASQGCLADAETGIPGPGTLSALLQAVKGTVDASLAERFAVRGHLFVVPSKSGVPPSVGFRLDFRMSGGVLQAQVGVEPLPLAAGAREEPWRLCGGLEESLPVRGSGKVTGCAEF